VTSEQIEALDAVAERLDARGLVEESRTLRALLAQLQRTPREVPASTAAEILHVTPQTVRNWVRSGILPGRRDRTGNQTRTAAGETHVRSLALLPWTKLLVAVPRRFTDARQSVSGRRLLL